VTVRSAEFVPYLNRIAGQRVLTGQHLVSNWEAPRTSYQELVTPLPVVPAMLGTTILTGADDTAGYNDESADIMADHVNSGGVVVLDIHPPSPWSPDQSILSVWVGGDGQEPKPDLRTLLTGTGKPAARWAAVRDRVDRFLSALPADGVAIFRPLHEACGEHFWWGRDATNPDRSESGVRALWADLQAHLSPRYPNLLWGWSAGMSWYAPLSYGVPDRFDLVGASLYSDTLTFPDKFGSDFGALTATGRPVLLFEAGAAEQPSGPTFDARRYVSGVHADYPAVVGVQAWQDGWAWANSANSSAALADPVAVNLAELASR
jgi:Glycosyl hydrolase family 26